MDKRRKHPPTGWRGAAALAVIGVAAAMMLWCTGCSRRHYKLSADRQVYGIIQAKSPRIAGMPQGFTIEQQALHVLEGCPRMVAPEPLSEDGSVDSDPTATVLSAIAPPGTELSIVSLAKALEIASLTSRDYQTQKESVFLTALSLTLQRYAFDPQFFGIITGNYDNIDTGDERIISADTSFGFGWLFKTGTRLSVSLASSFEKFLSGDPREAAASLFRINIAQPLLRGAGLAVTEPLTQAERNVIYELRDFVRFRRQFFLSVLSDYYGVLEDLQFLENQQRNYQSLLLALERAQALSEAGQMPPFQVDQTAQDVLASQDRVETRRQTYQASLDRFKVLLGLPTEAAITLDPRELEVLAEVSGLDLTIDQEAAIRIALENRLDLKTAEDAVADAVRRVEVAANDLLPGLDLSASMSTDTEGDNQPTRFTAERTDFNVGFELDLPLDRLSERNDFRRRLIDLERNRRDCNEARDQVVLQVRDSWRQFGRAKRSYEIQQESARLAERRVESTQLLLDAGRANARDMLEARQDLVDAQDQTIQALIDYRIASLELARDMEILDVNELGQLRENFEPYE